MEEDKHLDGRHTIEEAMSKSFQSYCAIYVYLANVPDSSGAHAQLSKVSKRFVVFYSLFFQIILGKTAFIKEMGVCTPCLVPVANH